MSHLRRSSRMIAVAATAVAMIALAGCSERTPTTSASKSDDLSVIVISGPLDDPYFGAMKRGADDAAKQLGVKVEYLSPSSSKEGSGPTLARLIKDAINKKPDALVVGNFFPDAENPVIKSATDAGMPVIVVNTGSDDWQKVGALAYVGLDGKSVGNTAGGKLADLGSKKALCVNPVPGNPFLEQACNGLAAGMKAAGKKSTGITIPYADATNPTKVQQAIAGALRADADIDGVFVFGSAVAGFAQKAADQVGRPITIGTGDLSTQVLKDIKAGKIGFALDSQPYLQSYYGVQMAAQYVRFGVMPQPVITGPLPITKENADKVLKINEQTRGIRGAA